jgi:hypothetical protein
MTTIEKIQKKGYKLTSNLGYENGEQVVVSITATKGNIKITERYHTHILNKIK